MSAVQRSSRDYIPVVCGSTCIKIQVEKIQLIEQHGRRLLVIDDDGDEYEFNGRIEDIAEKLVARSFYRPMKSLVINLEKIVRIDNYEILFDSGIIYAVGRNNMVKIRTAFKNYFHGYAPFTGGGANRPLWRASEQAVLGYQTIEPDNIRAGETRKPGNRKTTERKRKNQQKPLDTGGELR